jgi:uncharacterized protein
MEPIVLLIALLIVAAAILYSSVGHGGASAYLAIMALASIEPLVMRPAALVLNLVVASLAAVRFHRAGAFHVRSLLPFLVGSVPLAFVGGAIVLQDSIYKALVGIVLLAAAGRLWWTAGRADDERAPSIRPLPALAIGAGLGLLAGLTGTGGGIFLTPLLLMIGWAGPRQAGGLSAGFILCNSAAGLAGNVSAVGLVPDSLLLWAPAAFIGGLIGTELGVRRFSPLTLRRTLAVVLVVAGLKLLLIG